MAASDTSVTGSPRRTKSPKRYPPMPYTMVLVW